MSDTTTLRVGLAGLSEAAAQDLLPALRNAGADHGARVVAVSAPDRDRVRELLLDDSPVAIYPSGHALLAGSELDGLVIADAEDAPAGVAQRALRRGVHVFTQAPALAGDAQSLQRLGATAMRESLGFHVEHVPSRQLTSRDELFVFSGLGPVAGIRATWRGPDVALDAPGLVGLTTPAVTLLGAGRLDPQDVQRIGDGVRARWTTPDGRPVEIAVDPASSLPPGGEARLSAYSREHARLDLPLALPGAIPAPAPRLLRGVLWHPRHGAVLVAPPSAASVCLRQALEDWFAACRSGRSAAPIQACAQLAAQLAGDLALALGHGG